jgi:ABC-type glycerol-3-phosphate transport system substrate-binding protein
VSERGVSRRGVLAGLAAPVLVRAAVPAAAATLSACTRPSPSIHVAAVWSGQELAAFRKVLAGYEDQSGERVEVVTAGDDIDALLRSRDAAGSLPDVAILPQPGLVRTYVRKGRLVALPESFADGIADGLRELVTVDGQLYGVWVKTAHKSLFWYRPSGLAGHPPPVTWDQLVDLIRRLARDGRTPLAVAAADGWVLATWFANVLLAVAGGAEYERLASGAGDWGSAAVRAALDHLAELWSIPGAFPDGRHVALLTQFEQSVVDVLVTRKAAVMFEGDFVATVVDRFSDAGHVREAPRVFRFPTVAGSRPLVIGGDVAVAFKESGLELLRWLTRPDAVAPWVRQGGFLSPNRGVPLEQYPAGLARGLATELRAEERSLQFNLSDLLADGAGVDGRHMWRIMQNFFAAVSTPGAAPGMATRRAAADLVRAARG